VDTVSGLYALFFLTSFFFFPLVLPFSLLPLGLTFRSCSWVCMLSQDYDVESETALMASAPPPAAVHFRSVFGHLY